MSLQFVHSHDAQSTHQGQIVSLATTASNDCILSASADGGLFLHSSVAPHATVASSSEGNLSSLVWSMKPTKKNERIPNALVSMSVVGERTLVNSIAGRTTLIDTTSGEVLSDKLPSSNAAVLRWNASLAPKSPTYASTGSSGSLTIHSASHDSSFGEELAVLPTPSSQASFGLYTKYAPNSSLIAMSTEKGQTHIYDIKSETLLSSFNSHAKAVRAFDWSVDSQLLLTASDDKRLVLHDIRVGQEGHSNDMAAVSHYGGHTSWVVSTALSPDGRLALSGSTDNTVRVWDLAAGKSLAIIREATPIWSVAWRPFTQAQTTPGSIMGAGGSAGFVTGGADGVVRWYRSAGSI